MAAMASDKTALAAAAAVQDVTFKFTFNLT
jgi:hypothetical protein